MTPRLHVVTDDEVLAEARFLTMAAALGRELGGDVALHVRGHRTPAARVFAIVSGLEDALRGTGAELLVADRVDVALAVRGAGVRVSRHSIPVAAVRVLLGPDRRVAASVHSVGDGIRAAEEGADLLVLGTVWETPSHPGRAGAGPGLVLDATRAVDVPVVAIGGVTPERAAEAVGAGAAGVAVLRGVWAADDPVAAARAYLAAMPGLPAAPDAGAARVGGRV